MIQQDYRSVCINGITYLYNDIKDLCGQKMTHGESWEKEIYQFLNDWFSELPELEFQTSGSTGTPKCITFPRRAIVASAKSTLSFFNLKKGDSALLCLQGSFVASKMMIARAIIGHLNLIITKPGGFPLEGITQKIDFAAMVPLQVMNELQRNPLRLELIRKLIIGGSPIPQDVSTRLHSLKTKCWETYGMTETLTHVAVRPIQPQVSLFEALPGVTFKQNEEGCLIIEAPNIPNSPIVTHDIAELSTQTSFRIVGRNDNIINSGGIKISPEQLESKLTPYIKGPFAISSQSDKKLGERIVLVISDSQIIHNWKEACIKAKLHKFEFPKTAILLHDLPVTESGKIKRSELKQVISNMQ